MNAFIEKKYNVRVEIKKGKDEICIFLNCIFSLSFKDFTTTTAFISSSDSP